VRPCVGELAGRGAGNARNHDGGARVALLVGSFATLGFELCRDR
jgi:hypothetical protein